MPLSSGTQLGPYQILAPIGAGGMGDVYKARDARLDRMVAIKVSKERFSDRFEREARAVAALNHPNICTLHDVGPNYLVMELVAPSFWPRPQLQTAWVRVNGGTQTVTGVAMGDLADGCGDRSAKPADKTTPTSASTSAASQPNWEDPSGVEPGLGYEELVRRFGPPAMAITNAAERSLTYRGKDGVFQVEVRDGAVTAIVKPHR
jgi:Protein kinase domain